MRERTNLMKPMLFSVSYAGLWGQHTLDLEAFIHKAAELGYPTVELMAKRPHLSCLDTDDAQIKRLKWCADENGVEIATIAAYTNFTAGKSGKEVPLGEMQVLYVRRLAEIARELGANILRVFTGYSTDDTAYGEDWERCVRGVRECAAVAEPLGVCVAVQNHHDTGIATDAYVEFLDDVDHPNCRAAYDPWVPALLGEDMRACAKALAPRMAQTTLADYVRLKRFAYMPGLVNYREMPAMLRAVPVGDGFLGLAEFFAGLKDGGFDGPVAYEMCSPLRGGGAEENLDRTARISLERIRELI